METEKITAAETEKEEANDFIEDIINEELAEGKVTEVHTSFPPEPNG